MKSKSYSLKNNSTHSPTIKIGKIPPDFISEIKRLEKIRKILEANQQGENLSADAIPTRKKEQEIIHFAS